MHLDEFEEDNEDIFFLMYNSFNEFYEALTQSSQLFVIELYDRATEKNEICSILFGLAVSTLGIGILILIPVVSSVNKQKDKVLSLFCEIDNSAIKTLS